MKMGMKRSDGNMYPWVTHTHSHLAGECPHGCSYCYVQRMADDLMKRNIPTMKAKYSGSVRLIESELNVNYGTGKTIFIDHMNDLWTTTHNGVKDEWRCRVLAHCRKYPDNRYVFQTKNPDMYKEFEQLYPPLTTYGVTLESDCTNVLDDGFSYSPGAPTVEARIESVRRFPRDWHVFITVEPIMTFSSPEEFAGILASLKPAFVNIGADSRGCGLPEPTKAELQTFIAELNRLGVEIREKHNLERLLK